MTIPFYKSYKLSGIEWLGDIPAHWQLKPAKAFIKRKAERGFPDATLLSVYRDYGVIEKASRDDNFNRAADDLSNYLLVQKGDLVFNKMKVWQGSLGVSPHRGIVSPAYYTCSVSNDIHGEYLHYLLRSATYIPEYRRLSSGIRPQQWDLDYDSFKQIPLVVPSLAEQQAIAAFLDRETLKIDRLIEKQEQLIKLLEEKRQAEISHAVTKGLNPNVTLKDSGVEWLGKIPVSWKILPLKRAITFQRGHDLPSDKRITGNIPVVTSAGPSDFHNAAAAKGPGLVTGRYGTIGKFNLVQGDYWPLNTTLYSNSLHGNDPDFLWYMLHNLAPIFIANSQKSAVPGVDRNDLHPVLTALPASIEEQQANVRDLETRLARLSTLASESRSLINKLQERRSSLISAAVTGKIDVRGLVGRRRKRRSGLGTHFQGGSNGRI